MTKRRKPTPTSKPQLSGMSEEEVEKFFAEQEKWRTEQWNAVSSVAEAVLKDYYGR